MENTISIWFDKLSLNQMIISYKKLELIYINIMENQFVSCNASIWNMKIPSNKHG